MKKLLSAVLIVAMLAGMATPAFAAPSGWKVVDFCTDAFDEYGYNSFVWPELKEGKIMDETYDNFYDSGTLDLGTIAPGEELLFVVYQMDLEWEGPDGGIYNVDYGNTYIDEDGNAYQPNATLGDLRKAGLRCNIQAASGSGLMEDGTRFNPTKAPSYYVTETDGENVIVFKVPFIEEFISTKEKDFRFKFNFQFKDGYKYSINVMGTMENPTVEVNANTDYLNIGDGTVADVQAYNKNTKLDLGNGVALYAKLFADQKYYGTAKLDKDDAEETSALYKKYPALDGILTLNTVGLDKTANVVTLSEEYKNFFVYDKDLNFLGKGTEKLPFSPTYYLATAELEIEAAEK